jgi:hypothetical protein
LTFVEHERLAVERNREMLPASVSVSADRSTDVRVPAWRQKLSTESFPWLLLHRCREQDTPSTGQKWATSSVGRRKKSVHGNHPESDNGGLFFDVVGFAPFANSNILGKKYLSGYRAEYSHFTFSLFQLQATAQRALATRQWHPRFSPFRAEGLLMLTFLKPQWVLQ